MKSQTLGKGLELETKLLRMLDKVTKISYTIRNKKNDKIYLSDLRLADMHLIIQYLIREIIIMNPETWKILTTPEDLSFSFSISCNAAKEIQIFKKINELKKFYMGIKEIPDFRIISNFKGSFTMEYANERVSKHILNRSIDEIYKYAVAEETLREKKGLHSLWI